MLRTAARIDEGSVDPAERDMQNSCDGVMDVESSTVTSLGAQVEQAARETPFEELLDLGTEALLAKDYAAALEFFLEAEEKMPGNGLVLTNLERLQSMGITISNKEGK